jgi:hypothetical protein
MTSISSIPPDGKITRPETTRPTTPPLINWRSPNVSVSLEAYISILEPDD